MSGTLDVIKKAYEITRLDVKHNYGVDLPSWENLPDGYGAAFIHMFTAGRWNSETLEYELKPRVDWRSGEGTLGPEVRRMPRQGQSRPRRVAVGDTPGCHHA